MDYNDLKHVKFLQKKLLNSTLKCEKNVLLESIKSWEYLPA